MVNSATSTTDNSQVWKIIQSSQHKIPHTKEKRKLKHFKYYFKNLHTEPLKGAITIQHSCFQT